MSGSPLTPQDILKILAERQTNQLARTGAAVPVDYASGGIYTQPRQAIVGHDIVRDEKVAPNIVEMLLAALVPDAGLTPNRVKRIVVDRYGIKILTTAGYNIVLNAQEAKADQK